MSIKINLRAIPEFESLEYYEVSYPAFIARSGASLACSAQRFENLDDIVDFIIKIFESLYFLRCRSQRRFTYAICY